MHVLKRKLGTKKSMKSLILTLDQHETDLRSYLSNFLCIPDDYASIDTTRLEVLASDKKSYIEYKLTAKFTDSSA